MHDAAGVEKSSDADRFAIGFAADQRWTRKRSIPRPGRAGRSPNFPGFLEPRRQQLGSQGAAHLQEPGVQAVRRDRRKIQGFLERPLEGEWPYLWLDATYLKVRAGRIVSVAVTVAVAVNDQGRREVLGMAIGASEAETFWTSFCAASPAAG